MNNHLEQILLAKKSTVSTLNQNLIDTPDSMLAKIFHGEVPYSPKKEVMQALKFADHVKVIAEIKRRSPSKGDFAPITDPLDLAKQYLVGGACAISVLTEETAFGGCAEDLTNLAQSPGIGKIPLLRKDFLIDPIQIAESILMEADFILLIVAVLGDQLPLMLKKAHELNMPALVEVYKYDEIQQAIDAGAQIIGVNNRNLNTFVTDTQSAFELAPHLPKSAIKIAASGIFETSLAKEYHQAGYSAVLVGEGLVKSNNPAEWIAACKNSTGD